MVRVGACLLGSGQLLCRKGLCQVWWYIPLLGLFSVFWRQRLVDNVFKASLVNIVSSRSVKTT